MCSLLRQPADICFHPSHRLIYPIQFLRLISAPDSLAKKSRLPNLVYLKSIGLRVWHLETGVLEYPLWFLVRRGMMTVVLLFIYGFCHGERCKGCKQNTTNGYSVQVDMLSVISSAGRGVTLLYPSSNRLSKPCPVSIIPEVDIYKWRKRMWIKIRWREESFGVRPPKGVKTDWIMHEYRLKESRSQPTKKLRSLRENL
ncbi:unnamed protein product [Lactuca saligna]|uniref:NAC domain-containing protein n=1 Tax=Lactuca saligna TaxID=75948 RepID=A0AA35Y1T4_LACSI|nr:unnamed protein product [Lactuca saligna]